MTQNEFYRQIAEQTGEDMQTIERLGFSPVVPRRHRYNKRHARKSRKKQLTTITNEHHLSQPTNQHEFSRIV